MSAAERDEVLVEIGKLIRVERARVGITQDDLAYLCKIDRKTVNRIEAGRNATRITTLVSIAKALGVHPAMLFPAP